MSEFECSICKQENSDVSWNRVLGASLIGGIATGILYYIYCHLSDNQKDDIKKTICSQAKPAIVKYLTKDDEED